MKGKYITTQVLLACLSHKTVKKKDVYTQLDETIAERKIILRQWQKMFLSWLAGEKDIYAQLEKTIAERKKILQQWEKLFFPEQENRYLMEDKKAA